MDTYDPLTDLLAKDLDASFEALVQGHEDRIYTIALRMLGDTRDAEEAAQDTFVRAHRALDGYDRERISQLRLRPWLATIALNVCRSRLTRRKAHSRASLSLDVGLPGDLEPRAAESGGPAAIQAARDEAADWAALLMTIPQTYRIAIVLRHVDGLSYPELALALDRPEGTVKAQVHRGLGLLRAALESKHRRDHEEMTA